MVEGGVVATHELFFDGQRAAAVLYIEKPRHHTSSVIEECRFVEMRRTRTSHRGAKKFGWGSLRRTRFSGCSIRGCSWPFVVHRCICPGAVYLSWNSLLRPKSPMHVRHRSHLLEAFAKAKAFVTKSASIFFWIARISIIYSYEQNLNFVGEMGQFFFSPFSWITRRPNDQKVYENLHLILRFPYRFSVFLDEPPTLRLWLTWTRIQSKLHRYLNTDSKGNLFGW